MHLRSQIQWVNENTLNFNKKYFNLSKYIAKRIYIKYFFAAVRFFSFVEMGKRREQKSPVFTGLFIVHRTGVEPVTPSFVGWCSIQLSYRCKKIIGTASKTVTIYKSSFFFPMEIF
jgi:hypothetical protein